MASRSLVVINYRSAALTEEAIRSARTASSEPLQVVVVDNSTDADELGLLRDLPIDRLVASPRNLGYAGGINRAIEECEGEVVIASNPDVVFRPRAIDLLVEQLGKKVVLTGPSFSWDDGGLWMLPPAEIVTRAVKVDEWMAGWIPAWNTLRDRRRIRFRLRFWALRHPAAVSAVSGAVMALPRALFSRLGFFDERYPLYFEEIDFMRRITQAGLEIRYVPEARCRHLYSQSAGNHPDSITSYLLSEVEYHKKWSGDIFVSALRRLPSRRLLFQERFDTVSSLIPIEFSANPATILVEASPSVDFPTAAGHFPATNQFVVPTESWTAYKADELFVRLVARDTLRPLKYYRIVH